MAWMARDDVGKGGSGAAQTVKIPRRRTLTAPAHEDWLDRHALLPTSRRPAYVAGTLYRDKTIAGFEAENPHPQSAASLRTLLVARILKKNPAPERGQARGKPARAD